MIGNSNLHSRTSSVLCNNLGFLQKNNNLEERTRIASSFKESQSSKNVLSSDNSSRDSRFMRVETDFSNLFARGKWIYWYQSPGGVYVVYSMHDLSKQTAAWLTESQFCGRELNVTALKDFKAYTTWFCYKINVSFTFCWR